MTSGGGGAAEDDRGSFVDRYMRFAATLPMRVATAVILVVVIPLALWDRRGAAVGIAAIVVYGALMLPYVAGWGSPRDWSRQHPALDCLWRVPLAFLALAYVPGLPLVGCAVVALVAGLVLSQLARRRRDP